MTGYSTHRGTYRGTQVTNFVRREMKNELLPVYIWILANFDFTIASFIFRFKESKLAYLFELRPHLKHATGQSSQKCDIKKLVFALHGLEILKCGDSMGKYYTQLILHGNYSHFVFQAIVWPALINGKSHNLFKRAKKDICYLDPNHLIYKKFANHISLSRLGFIRKDPKTNVSPRSSQK